MSRATQPDSVRLHWDSRASPAARTPRDFFTDESHRADDTSLHASLLDADNADALTWLARPAQRDALAREGGLRCVYIDPPYATQTTHGVRTRAGHALAYDDRWTMPEYLAFMHERLVLIHALLEHDGVLFVHCDWRANAYLRVLLDEVFGAECFRNEIVWRRAPNLGRQARALQLGRTADSILVYSRTPKSVFRGVAPIITTPVPLTRRGTPAGARWDDARRQWYTLAPRGDYTDESIERLRRQGRVYTSATGTHSIKYFLRALPDGSIVKDTPADTIWDDDEVAPLRHAPRAELEIGYTTQKPESLLRRILTWATREGDLVADFFAGSGTTLACAHTLGRRWIGCERGMLGVHAIRKRMLALGAPLRILRCEPRTLGVCRAIARGRTLRITVEVSPQREQGATDTLSPRVTRRKHSRARTTSQPDTLLIGVQTARHGFQCALHAPITDTGTVIVHHSMRDALSRATHLRAIDPLGGATAGEYRLASVHSNSTRTPPSTFTDPSSNQPRTRTMPRTRTIR